MQTYELVLESNASENFYSQKACDSMDIDASKKLKHEFKITGDFFNDFNIGLIFGASGSGKTTIAKKIFNKEIKSLINENIPIIEQFPESFTYDDRSSFLNSVGLSQVVCWIRPVNTLSNGQKFRAEIAIQCAFAKDEIVVIDEWTSVVDRTVAKAMSSSIQKFARKMNKKIVLISCHEDVEDWLLPDWKVDCNEQNYFNYRGLLRQRTEKINFEIRECDKSSWKMFSKYHYLSEKIPGGSNIFYGLFLNGKQIGFQCFSNYVPDVSGKKRIYHSNRTVIHPDYVGFGLGIKLINETSKIVEKNGFRVVAKFSSIPIFKSMSKSEFWKLLKVEKKMKPTTSSTSGRFANSNGDSKKGERLKVKTFTFEFRSEFWN